MATSISRGIIPPVPHEMDWNSESVYGFLEALRRQVNNPRYYSLIADPTVADIPDGTWGVWKNTTSGLVKVFTNDGGVIKSVTLI